jgi:hypothetical protein
MKLDAKTVARLAIPECKADVIYFDDDLAGFGLRLRRSGDVIRKAWVVQYRKGRSTRRVKLAPFEAMTADAARKAARKLLGHVWTGHDPQAERQAKRDREEHTLRKVAADYVKARRGEWRGRSGILIERYLTGPYFKPLHSKPIAEIERLDVNACIRTMVRERSGGGGARCGGPAEHALVGDARGADHVEPCRQRQQTPTAASARSGARRPRDRRAVARVR